MKKIYREGNYIILEDGGNIFVFPVNHSEYNEFEDHFIIRKFPNKGSKVISFSNVGDWNNEDMSEQFTISSLRDFFRKNTGFNSASGGSDAYLEGLGWVQVSDNEFSIDNPRFVSSGVRAKITNNSFSIIDLVGMSESTTIWNPITNNLEPKNIGDSYDLRVQFKVKPNLNNRNLTLDLDIGGTQGVIWSKPVKLQISANIETQVTELMDIYCLGTFVSNGGSIFVTCDGDFEMYDIVFKIEKKFING